jgi:hypothetical protein
LILASSSLSFTAFLTTSWLSCTWSFIESSEIVVKIGCGWCFSFFLFLLNVKRWESFSSFFLLLLLIRFTVCLEPLLSFFQLLGCLSNSLCLPCCFLLLLSFSQVFLSKRFLTFHSCCLRSLYFLAPFALCILLGLFSNTPL